MPPLKTFDRTVTAPKVSSCIKGRRDGDEHDDEGEPSRGWTFDGVIDNGNGMDLELDTNYATPAQGG